MPRAARPRGNRASEGCPAPPPRERPLSAWAFSALSRIDLQGLFLATAISVGGGPLFFFIALPWMLGAAFSTTVAALSGVRVVMPLRLRNLMFVILGVLVGSSFTSEVLQNGSMAGLAHRHSAPSAMTDTSARPPGVKASTRAQNGSPATGARAGARHR
jgi:hypothetical protein